MPKMKTNRAVAKRMKKNGSGKIIHYKSMKSHILTKKTKKRKRGFRQSTVLHCSNFKQYSTLIPN